MLKVLYSGKKKLSITILIVTISVFSQISTNAFGLTNATYSQNQTTALNGLKLGNIDSNAEQDFINRTNALRASLGVGPLRANSELLTKARNWSQTQANAGTIFHSTLTDGVSQNWQSLGENVGMGPDVLSIHNALVASPRHYQNLVDPRFTEIGMGVINQNGTIYVTQVFMQFMPEPIVQTPTTTTTQAPTQSNNVSSPVQGGGKKSVGVTQSAPAPSQTPAAEEETPIVQALPFETASQELIDVIAKIHKLEN
jgi:uncharacterized protein YkwD